MSSLQRSASAVDTLNSPVTLPNGVVIGNRLAKSAMSECLGNADSAPTDLLTTLYRRWADSGAGLLITGNVMIDRGALGEAGNVAVEDDRDLAALQAWATAGRARGAQVWAQINHPGRQVPALLTNARPVAPSAVGVSGLGLFRTPRELTNAEIEKIIGQFASSAKVLVSAGFTGVQIHGAHGYLISQFLSPATNLRIDAWGGTPAKRRRFLLEVVRAVRAEIGADASLAVKLNSADFQRGGFGEDESSEVVGALDGEGIDLVEISGGTYESTAFMGTAKASTVAREAYFLEFAERIRAGVTTPLMLTGGFRSANGMADAIASGAIDIVGLARPLALEPDLPQRLLDGVAQQSTVRHRTVGIARVDGFTELLWHSAQLRRMGQGKDPSPNRHPVLTLLDYSAPMLPYTVHRLVRTLS